MFLILPQQLLMQAEPGKAGFRTKENGGCRAAAVVKR
jgi:hypothetical protein